MLSQTKQSPDIHHECDLSFGQQSTEARELVILSIMSLPASEAEKLIMFTWDTSKLPLKASQALKEMNGLVSPSQSISTQTASGNSCFNFSKSLSHLGSTTRSQVVDPTHNLPLVSRGQPLDPPIVHQVVSLSHTAMAYSKSVLRYSATATLRLCCALFSLVTPDPPFCSSPMEPLLSTKKTLIFCNPYFLQRS